MIKIKRNLLPLCDFYILRNFIDSFPGNHYNSALDEDVFQYSQMRQE